MNKKKNKKKSEKRSITHILQCMVKDRTLQVLIAILLITALIYARSYNQTFLFGWDDGEYITNPDIKNLSITNIGKYFSSFYLGMYQPIPVLTFALNIYLGGENPVGFHLFSILIHFINILLVFNLVKKLSGSNPAAILSALLLAVHPMNVESISWLSARSTGLFSMFYLLALSAYLKYIREGLKTSQLLLVLTFFITALFCKSMAATLPMVLVVLDFWEKRKVDKKMIFEKIPFFALSIIFGLISIRAAASFGHITVLEADYTLIDRMFLLSYGAAFYLVKLLIPVNLSAIYAYPDKTAGWLPAEYYLSLLLILLLAIGIFRLKRYRRETLLGVLFFLLSISMVLPLFWSRLFIVAERYVYLPYIGLFCIGGIWFNALLNNEIKIRTSTRTWILGVISVWILVFGISSFVRTSVWRDTRSLMEDVIDKKRSPADQAFAWFFLGNISDREGNNQQAIKNYSLAINMNPRHIQALNNRGIMLGIEGDFQGSLNDFNEAIHLKPDFAEAFYNRGIVYYRLNRQENACKDWQQAAYLGFGQAKEVLNNYCNKSGQ